jgi:sRNA-binding carbon storage regulator CsrA
MLVLSRRSQESVVVGGATALDQMFMVTVIEIGLGHR